MKLTRLLVSLALLTTWNAHAAQIPYCTTVVGVTPACFTITYPDVVPPPVAACTLPMVCMLPPPVVVPPPPLPANTALLTWDLVSGATGYRVYTSNVSGVYSVPGTGVLVAAPPYTTPALALGFRYFFVVTAVLPPNESPFSNEVFKDIGVVVPPVVDITPPVVNITAPVAGAIVTGTIPLTAIATDNVGVVGVQFGVDSANYAAEITVPPYTTTWNSTVAANGSHTINAVARDAAGNRASSALVTVTVANAAPPAPVESPSGTTVTTVGGGPIIDRAVPPASWTLAPKDPAVEGGVQLVVKRNGVTKGAAGKLCYAGGFVNALDMGTTWYQWTDVTSKWNVVPKPVGCL